MLSGGPPLLGGFGLVDRRELVARGLQAVGPDAGGSLMSPQVDEGDGGQHHEDQRRADGPAQLERRVAADLGRPAGRRGARGS